METKAPETRQCYAGRSTPSNHSAAHHEWRNGPIGLTSVMLGQWTNHCSYLTPTLAAKEVLPCEPGDAIGQPSQPLGRSNTASVINHGERPPKLTLTHGTVRRQSMYLYTDKMQISLHRANTNPSISYNMIVTWKIFCTLLKDHCSKDYCHWPSSSKHFWDDSRTKIEVWVDKKSWLERSAYRKRCQHS